MGTKKDAQPAGRDVNAKRRASLRILGVFAGVFIFALMVLGLLAVARSTATFGTAMLVAAAALACGGLLGFLFGIPRSLQADRGPAAGDSAPLGQNTNLEQISDWLTKILVGVGLVQFGAIGSAAGRLINSVATAFEPLAGAKVLAGTLVVLPSVTGFMIGYIGTRTGLFQMFTDFARLESLVRTEVSQAVQKDGETLNQLFDWVNTQLDSRGAAPDPAKLAGLLAEATPAQRDQVFQRAKQARRLSPADELVLRRAIPVFTGLVEVAPDRYVYRAELGAALVDVGHYADALAELDKAIAMRGPVARFDWFEFHRARARIGLVKPGDAPDHDTVALLTADLAVAWQKQSFRSYVQQVLAADMKGDPEYETLARLRPYLPPGAVA